MKPADLASPASRALGKLVDAVRQPPSLSAAAVLASTRTLAASAPAHCSPADIGGPSDAHFLNALIAEFEKSMDAARMRDADLRAELVSALERCAKLTAENRLFGMALEAFGREEGQS